MTEENELLPCPFCGAGDSQIVENGKVWTGMKYSEPTSVSVRHWCTPISGQPSRMLERVGKDHASAVAAWNTRAAPTPPAQPAERMPLTDVRQPFLCLSPVCGPTCCECNCAISPQDQLKYAKRYAFLRNRDLDSIKSGGVFAGMTPSNVVLNGDDLDAEIDGSIEAANNITASTRSESLIHAVNHVVEPREGESSMQGIRCPNANDEQCRYPDCKCHG